MPGIARTKRILIVDDERDLVAPLEMRLSASGRFEVSSALDGEEGLRKAQMLRPDVALIDLTMPEMDGWHLCRRLREDERTRGTRIVVMTAWASPDLERRASSEGVAKILLKPFEVPELMAALEGETEPEKPEREARP